MRAFSAGVAMVLLIAGDCHSDQESPVRTPYDATAVLLTEIDTMNVGSFDWPQWGGSSNRNNTPYGENIPVHWDIETGENILWSTPLGSQSWGVSAIANGKLYIGTNNRHGYVERFPRDVDLGCMLCFDAATGEFLWQHSNLKLPTGRVHDWPEQGVCSVPYCDGDRLWYVSNRGEVCCLDAEGFRDGENDGPFVSEESESTNEADVVWKFNMMAELGTSQHNMCTCSCTCYREILFVNTSNGVDESHVNIPAPHTPAFVAMNKSTGEVLWTDNSPGENILHGQWCSPTFAVLGGVPQVLFGGGDGWLRSFTPEGDDAGNAVLLWEFDCNPKASEWILGGRGTRNNIIAAPVVYDGLVYVAVGQDPEHGEGVGHLWCIDPTKRGDVSSELAVNVNGNPLPPRRRQAVIPEQGERAIENPNSAVVWHHSSFDLNRDGKIDWEEEFHRTISSMAIKNDLLFIADFSGLFHCINARTGREYWTYDLFSAAWGSPLIVDGKVYIGDEDGDIAVFELSREQNVLAEVYMENSVYGTPVVANNVLYISNRDTLFAIAEE